MPDITSWTPYLAAAFAAANAWLFKQQIQTGKDLVAVQTTLKIYFERQGQGVAKLLDSNNPTPEHIRALLREYRKGDLNGEELRTLKEGLRQMMNDKAVPRNERGMAMQFLGSIEAIKELERIKPRKWWQLWS